MIEYWMSLAILVFAGHTFVAGFFLGTYYVKHVADLHADANRPDWLQAAIDAYRESHRRPLAADELEDVDWERSE